MAEPLHKRPAQRDDRAAVRLARLASRQEGVVHEAQVRTAGLDRRAAGRWVHAGRLHRKYPGVYLVGHRALSFKGELVAALFYAGAGAALSHRSAAHWWQLIPAPPPTIHISVARRTRPTDGIVLHHPTRLDRVLHHRLPVTPVARTLLDLATDATDHEVRKALAEADFHERLDARDLESVTGQGRPGSRRLRRAYRAHLPELARTETPLEDEFLLLCERCGIPLPEPNVWIGEFRVDALWREERVVVELDGRDAHSSEARRLMDHRRDLKVRSLGYVVRRYSWHQVFRTPDSVARDVLEALASRRTAAQTSR
jgi:hypothetical protein